MREAAGYEAVTGMRLLLSLSACSLLAGGCGGPPARPAAVSRPSASPPGVASTAPSPPSPAAKPAVLRAEIPARLNKDEQKELAGPCKPFVDAFERAVAGSAANGRLNAVIHGLDATLASPPKVPDEARDRCRGLLERDARGYVIATLGVDARVQLGSLAQLMKVTLEENGTMCPSTTRPMPPEIPAFYTQLPREVWKVEPWACLLYETERTSVQLEIQTSSDGATFIARAIPFPTDGRVVEWKLEATLIGGVLTWEEPEIVK